MNKKALITLGVILVLVCGFYVYFRSRITSTTISSQTDIVNKPFDQNNFFKGETSFEKVTSYKNSTTKDVVSFKLLTDKSHQARNDTFDVYLNQKSIGQVSGQGFSMASFSSDGKYFVFRTRAVSGCLGMCQDFSVYVVDIAKGKLVSVSIPSNNKISTLNKTTEKMLFPASVEFKSQNKLMLTSYFVGVDRVTNDFNQISPKESWLYDLSTQQSTFL